MDGNQLMPAVAMPAGAVQLGMQAGRVMPLPVIGEEEIREAETLRLKYVSDKQGYDEMLRSNQRWIQLRHWGDIRPHTFTREDGDGRRDEGKDKEILAKSGWLLRSYDARHADAMDGFPTCNILAREQADHQEAKILSALIPAILEQNHFEDVYDELQNRKIGDGSGVYGVYWDGRADNGIGEISIRDEDLLNLCWDFRVKDIQDSKNLFYYREVPLIEAREEFPQLADLLTGMPGVEGYDTPGFVKDQLSQVVVVDWYYKKWDERQGRRVLHLVKYVQNQLIFASENEVDEAGNPMYPGGWYEHGQFPFIIDSQHRMAGSPLGIGLVTVGKVMQEFIDRGDTAFMKSLLWGSEPRYMAREGSLNEEEFADITKHVVHYTGNGDAISPIEPTQVPSSYLQIWQAQIDALRETTGSNEVSTGGTVSGVTAASAIAAMQEAAGKTSRDTNRGSYRAYRKVIEMVIELIRQFYTLPHYYRIAGQDQTMEVINAVLSGQAQIPELASALRETERYVAYTNTNIMAREYDGVYRRPMFDVSVTAQKASPYSKMAANELALSFYNGGFFTPENGIASLAALEMMDFDQIDKMRRIITQNYMMYIQQMQEAQMGMGAGLAAMQTSTGTADPTKQTGGDDHAEPDNVTRAKERAAQTTQI